MKILVVGGGAREHAIVWKLSRSPKPHTLYAAPGNPGIARLAACVPIPATDIASLVAFAETEKITLTVVGPEAPLAAGLADALREKGHLVFGPNRLAAEIESSKVFSKELMRRHGIPTAEFHAFDNFAAAQAHLSRARLPLVVKADGLAAGKGVSVCATREEALAAVAAMMMDRRFGEAGDRIIVEEFLEGEEVSILVVTDGNTILPLAPSQDHKRVGDHDAGPNTGGMGAYSPVPFLPGETYRKIERTVLLPTVHALNAENRRFCGILYAGIILTADGPKALEFNARFGDPETEVILPRLTSDLAPILYRAAEGTLAEAKAEWDERAAVTVVLASGGYPGAFKKGIPIEGADTAPDAVVFHAGTAEQNGKLVTAGGRVLAVTALGATIAAARDTAYNAVRTIRFDGMHYRRDIGAKAMKTMKPGGNG
ncbi:MAG: phosphoribosylamine--glycine ligase [Planctomycetota bacterium]